MPASALATRLSDRLGRDILAGVLAQGAHLGAQGIADRYGVSRTPVREALAGLERAGLICHRPNRGYFVADPIPAGAALRAGGGGDADPYQAIAEDWLTDRLAETVTERDLRRRYGLSRARLAGILARAAREGWAEPREGYGWRLLPVAKTPEAFDEIYRFRLAIEPAAMLEPGFTVDRAVLDRQRRVQEGMLETDIAALPAEHLLANGAAFHEDLARMSHNPFFVAALERVNRMRRLMEYRTRVDRDRLAVQCADHLRIIGLLERGEIAEASGAMRRHLSGALKRKSPIARRWSAAARAET